MALNVAERAFAPARGLLEEIGDMIILTGKTLVSALRPPYPYGGEFVSQFLFALRLCWFPLLVSTVAFGYGAPGLQAAIFLVLFGALVTALRARPDAVPSHPAMALFPLRIGAWTGDPISLPSDQATVLGHPDYTMATYAKPDGSIANLFVAYYDRQQQGTAIHSPKACLPGGGWKVVSSRVVQVRVPGGTVPMNRVLIEGDGAKQLVYYGFFQRGRWMTNEYAVKAALLWDAVVRNRTDGALVRIVGPVQATETEQMADRKVTALLTDSYPAIVQFVPR